MSENCIDIPKFGHLVNPRTPKTLDFPFGTALAHMCLARKETKMNTIKWQIGETANKVEQMTWAGQCSLIVSYIMLWVVVFNVAG